MNLCPHLDSRYKASVYMCVCVCVGQFNRACDISPQVYWCFIGNLQLLQTDAQVARHLSLLAKKAFTESLHSVGLSQQQQVYYLLFYKRKHCVATIFY